MERRKFLDVLRCMSNVCKDTNDELIRENQHNGIEYEVLQLSELSKTWNIVQKISDFYNYNYNWQGNKDFMHIPNFQQVLHNCLNYPIIIAKKRDSDDILAISTIKYDENTEDKIDPYFPEENAKYFSVTGILVKRNNPYKGMGKKIYEIAIRGAYEYNKLHPNTRLMCVIDCRNNHSLRALASAVDRIRDNNIFGENMELPANIVGYYELKQGEALEEASTLVLEVGLEEKIRSNNVQENTIEYNRVEGSNLFDTLRGELRKKFMKYGICTPIVNVDGDSGTVFYYSLQDDCRLSSTKIISNGTEEGNDRKPIYDKYMHEFLGPIRNINLNLKEER